MASDTGAEPPGESTSTTTDRTRGSSARALIVRTISGPRTVIPMVPEISRTAIRGAFQGSLTGRGGIPSIALLLSGWVAVTHQYILIRWVRASLEVGS